jgi:DNA polymerase III subunit alpha
MDNLVHLHVHSEHSFLDGLSTLDSIVERAVDLGQSAIAVTDHGEVSGHFSFQRKADKHGVKPIFGMEGYFTDNRHEKVGKKGEFYDHMTIIALNQTGLTNLWSLSSEAWLEGSYYGDPRFDWELLNKYSEGLAITGGCMGGCVGKFLNEENKQFSFEKAYERISRFQSIFKDNFFLEIHSYTSPDSERWNKQVVRAAQELSVPLLTVSDSHYTKPEDWYAHEVMTAVQMGKTINDEDRFSYGPNQLCIISEQEMLERLSYLPGGVVSEAIKNTTLLSEQCDVQIKEVRNMPVFFSSKEQDVRKLKEAVEDGFNRKIIGKVPDEQLQFYRDRIDYEAEIIVSKGFPGYFHMVADVIKWSKDEGMLVGPSRGSVGGSLLAYCMDITEIDPIPAGLLFERFLDPGRDTMPDIDIDFPKIERQLVRDHLEEKYGKLNITSISTLNTLGVKQTIRDLCRGLAISHADTDKICKIVDDNWTVNHNGPATKAWKKLLKECRSDFAPWKETYPELFDLIPKLLDHIRHSSAHAAGVVISKENLIGKLPLRFKTGDVRTQFEKDDVEALGFVKVDVLGLRTLSTLMAAYNLIKRNYGEDELPHFYKWSADWDKYYNDDSVWDMLCNAHTVGCFQIETSNLTSLIKRFKPRSVEDLSTLSAVCRPGISRSIDPETGMTFLELYLQKKTGHRPVVYKHPNLKKVLESTYGTFVYQEQIMEACVELAGYSLAETDRVRRAMAKQKVSEMAKERKSFIDGCHKNGIDEQLANSIFDEMQAFGVYGFNKSHAYGYGVLGYWTAYIKKHYPKEFMTALFQTNPAQSVVYIREARRMGIQVLGPDINESSSGYTLTKNGAIRYGLNSVKFVGGSASHIQKLGPFSSMLDFVTRVPKKQVNKRAIMALVKCGVFDSIVVPESGRSHAEQALYEYWKARGDWKNIDDRCNVDCAYCGGRISVFECYCEQEKVNDRALAEREFLGTLVSLDPLGDYIDIIVSEENFPGEKKLFMGEKATIGGLIAKVKELVTKRGKNAGAKMCQLWIELPNNIVEEDDDYQEYIDDEEENYGGDNMVQLVCFPDAYAKYGNSIEVGAPVIANVEKLQDGMQLKHLFRLDLLKKEVA